MSAALSWYVAVQGLGFLAFLVAAPFLRALPDAGYASSKALGVLLLGLLVWVGTALGVLRNEPGGTLLALIILGACALVQAARVRRPDTPGGRYVLPPRHVVVAVELLFLAAFAGWCLVRFADPAANHTEQPMDLMLLTAISASPTFPAGDPWLSGFPIGYYYLGYWLVSSVGFLAGIEPGVAYNVGQACWFGLLLSTCFGVGYNLAVLATTASRPSARAGLAAGGLAVVLAGLASNLHLALEWIVARWTGRTETLVGSWWWWRSSRAVRDVDLAGQPIEIITEFPFFSYLLGDNHPHLLAMPFVALIVSLSLALMLNGRQRPTGSSPKGAADPRVGPGALLVVACAALIGLNTWDFPAAVLLGLIALALSLSAAPPTPAAARRPAMLLTAGLLAIIVLTVPYFLTAQSQVRGVLPNLFHPTALREFATMFGVLTPGVILLLRLAWRERPPAGRQIIAGVAAGLGACALWLVLGGYWAANTSAGAEWLARMTRPGADPSAAAFDRWLTGWPVLALVISALAVSGTLLWSRARNLEDTPAGITFGLVLITIGFLLALVPEVVYAHDSFGTRMNTVFKFYYQAWLYLALAGALGMTLAWKRGGGLRAGAAGSALVLLVALLYAPAALWTKTQEGRAASGSLDALDYLRRQRPAEHAAIMWVRSNTRPGTVIAQAPGNSYDVAHNIISVATARPTLIGWEGHERQWRGPSYDAMAAGRHDALARIYAPESDSDLQQTLLAWNVMFVYVGPVERARYFVSSSHEARLARTMELVFDQGGIRIYRRRG